MQVGIISFITLAVIYQAQSAPSDDFLTKLRSAKETCKTADQAKDEETFGKVWGLRSLPDSESENCFMACLMKNFGAIVDGKYNVEVFHLISENRWGEEADIEKAKEIDEHCVKQVNPEGMDECAAAQELIKCFFDKSAEAGLKDKA